MLCRRCHIRNVYQCLPHWRGLTYSSKLQGMLMFRGYDMRIWLECASGAFSTWTVHAVVPSAVHAFDLAAVHNLVRTAAVADEDEDKEDPFCLQSCASRMLLSSNYPSVPADADEDEDEEDPFCLQPPEGRRILWDYIILDEGHKVRRARNCAAVYSAHVLP
jgi:hypothetical protein